MAGYPPAYRPMVRMLEGISKISYDNESTLSKCALRTLGGHVPPSHVTLSPYILVYI